MTKHNNQLIYPCPFSKDYGIPSQQAWQLLNVFFLYRFILSCLFVIFFYSRIGPPFLGAHNTQLYINSSLIYLFLSLISGIAVFWRLSSYSILAQTLIFTDIILITLLMHACGGITSGIGILLFVTTAAGGLLIGGRCAMLFSALAAIAILSEQIYTWQTHAYTSTAFTYAGMLGASFFTIALLAHILAGRTEEKERLANQRKQTISKLEEINQYIIQHMQSGIILADQQLQINMSNGAALRLLDMPNKPDNLSDISSELILAFKLWQIDSSLNIATLKLPNQSELHLRFTLLPTRHESFYMITLEDIALYNQRLQQSKLASLGRLSASIAHEIRNPLGAISHAGQLLSECPDLTRQDQRLTEIIQTQSTRVNQIVESILQLSRRKVSRRVKIDLKCWLQGYLQKFIVEHNIDPAKFNLLIEHDNLFAYMDPNHLQQILDNLCFNALKHGSVGTERITIKAFNHQNSPAIKVIDNGSKINNEHIDLLFEPFFTTSTSGTGLGLYISRELAELNQAKLSYSLTGDNKTSFQLSLSNAEKSMIEI
jgi:two-component system, NtrC family, sensor histidine kinase PilS